MKTAHNTRCNGRSVVLPKCSLTNFEQSLVFCNFMAVGKVEVTNAHYTLYFSDGFQAKFGVKNTKISRKFTQVKLQNLKKNSRCNARMQVVHDPMRACSDADLKMKLD